MKSQRIHTPLLLVVVVFIVCFAVLGILRLHIDTDIAKSLPAHEQVIADALEIFHNHPIHDQVAVDIMIDRTDPDILVDCSTFLQKKMRASGLFADIGMGDVVTLIPEIAQQAAHHLPYLFSHEELENKIAPRLQESAVNQRLQDVVTSMTGLEGIGQTSYVAIDPLGLKDLVLARLIHLAPSHNAKIYKENLISQDGRHLLLTGRPAKAGSNTTAARQITELFLEAEHELNQKFSPSGIHIVLTPTGSYQAALDNENIIRHDVQLALGLSMAGIALLLILAFPRPLFSLLSLIPPLAGTAAALFVYSLFHSSISIMVLGFSGALISIMDDFSITYLLFFDRPQATKGKQAAREVHSIGGIIALLTTIASFLVLSLSDFPVFAELGEFTALGLSFTYLFIYFICPKIFPDMPPSGKRNPPLHLVSSWLFKAGKPGLIAALLFACVMLFFAKPEFHLSLSDMNTVSKKTQEEGRMFSRIWGDIGQRVYLMTTAESRDDLQARNDKLLESIEHDIQSDRVQSAFNPSMIFPGKDLGAKNRAAWGSFWTQKRVDQVKQELAQAGTALGFKSDAFDPFFALLNPDTPIKPVRLSSRYDKLLGITTSQSGRLAQFIAVTPGKQYNAQHFMAEYGKNNKIFDATYFSAFLSHILFTTYTSSLAIMTVIVTLMLFLYFLDWRLTCITVLPLVFAYICTLGTLNIIGHPLDIPGLMLTVVILGIGVDYSIYTVCGRRRYGSSTHSSYILVQSAVLLSAASTLIGFGVLCFAEHSTLKSVGITSLCGIGYSFLGTILLVPPLLEATFESKKFTATQTDPPANRILQRYLLGEAFPRMFARFKLNGDPLFHDLPRILGEGRNIKTILDIGCGFGVPACWLLEHLPQARIIGIDPDPQRVRVARMAVQERGTIIEGAAPELPNINARPDLVLLLDMLHYLDDRQLTETFARVGKLLDPGARLIARFVIRPKDRPSLSWYAEDLRARFAGCTPSYRSTDDLKGLLTMCGFNVLQVSPTANRELFWIVGQAGEQNPSITDKSYDEDITG